MPITEQALNLPELEARIEANAEGRSRFSPESIAASTVATMRVISELECPGQLIPNGGTTRMLLLAPLSDEQRMEILEIAQKSLTSVNARLDAFIPGSEDHTLALADIGEWGRIQQKLASGSEEGLDLSALTHPKE